MKKKLFIIAVLAALLVALFALLNYSGSKKPQSGKLTVMTTLFPLYDFAVNVGGDKADVSLLLPPGVDAHSFEPKPSDIAKINEADIFIYTGKFMEPWAEDVINSLDLSVTKTAIVDSSSGIPMIPGVFHDQDEPASSSDPHIWLDFDNDKKIIDNITGGFIAKDPSNAQFYQTRADEYKAKLSALDNEYKSSLADCRSREFVYGGHYAFGYLARRYGLQYFAAQGVSPDAEPTAKDLINLTDQIKRDNIKYVFYEELTSPKIAETLATETQAKLLLLNAAHNVSKEDFENNVTFISIMKDNLQNLKIGLQCDN